MQLSSASIRSAVVKDAAREKLDGMKLYGCGSPDPDSPELASL